MRRTTTTAAALLCTAALALTGCGREASSAGGEAQSKAISDGKAKGTIEIWAMGTEGDALDDFSKAFEKENPDADVKVTAIPWDAAHDKISSAIAAGKTPDASLLGTTWMGEFAAADGLMPTPNGLVDEADFFPGAWSSTEVGGTSYGVPWYVETRVLYYKTKLAQQTGWDQAPQSWAELKKFAKDMQGTGAKEGINLQPGQTGSWQTFMPFAWSAGASLTDDDGTKYTIESDATTKALDYYSSFFADKLSGTEMLDPGELEGRFAEGSIASFISGPWHTQLVEDAGVKPEDYAVAPLPGENGGQGDSFVGGGDLAVFKSADNPDGAWKFVQWLSQPETQQAFYEKVGDLPAVQSAWDSGALASDEHLKVFGKQLETAKAPPAVPTWEQVAAIIDAQVEKAAKGSEKPGTAVEDMQSEAAKIGTGL